MANGIIYASKAVWDHEHPAPTTLDGWKEALLLPASYRVLDVRSAREFSGDVWQITVDSEQIPAKNDGSLPEVVPIYRQDDGVALLDRVEFRDGTGSQKQGDG